MHESAFLFNGLNVNGLIQENIGIYNTQLIAQHDVCGESVGTGKKGAFVAFLCLLLSQAKVSNPLCTRTLWSPCAF